MGDADNKTEAGAFHASTVRQNDRVGWGAPFWSADPSAGGALHPWGAVGSGLWRPAGGGGAVHQLRGQWCPSSAQRWALALDERPGAPVLSWVRAPGVLHPVWAPSFPPPRRPTPA